MGGSQFETAAPTPGQPGRFQTGPYTGQPGQLETGPYTGQPGRFETGPYTAKSREIPVADW